MALSLHDVRYDPVANRALSELMHHYTVAEEKSRLVLTKKSGDMKLFLYDLDDLHQLDFFHNQHLYCRHEVGIPVNARTRGLCPRTEGEDRVG